MGEIRKAYAISDAKIQFVSLVDKAANKRTFLITKAESGQASFRSVGRIVKADAETHYITGVVYEPMTQDAHDNYMTADEIFKAAEWYRDHGEGNDVQHNFEAAEGIEVLESYIAPGDITVGEEKILKGSWVMTVRCTNDEIWERVQKGEITGFSMGGVGLYSEEDVDISEETVAKSLWQRIKKWLLDGIEQPDPVQKGDVAEKYETDSRESRFFSAISALRETLSRWEPDGEYSKLVFEHDPEKVALALSEFNAIVTKVLTEGDSVEKSGRKMSAANKKKLDALRSALDEFAAGFDDEDGDDNNKPVQKEDIAMDEKKMQEMIDAAVKKALDEQKPTETPAPTTPPVEEKPAEPTVGNMTKAEFDAAIEKAVNKALGNDEEDEEDADEDNNDEDFDERVEKAVMKALKNVRGTGTNLNDGGKPVKKAEEDHFLKGIL